MDLRKIVGETAYRSLPVDRAAVDPQTRTLPLSFSSELAVPRWWGIEILSHEPGACRMDRLLNGAPLLADHNSSRIIGVVESATCDPAEKKGRATVRFSKSPDGELIYQDVMDNIRRNVSVGYIVHDAEEMKPEEMSPELMKMAVEEKVAVLRVTDWEPLEISIVGIPADTSVGVGRSANPAAPDGALQEQVTRLSAEIIDIRSTITGKDTSMDPKSQEQILQEERERVKELDAIKARFTGKVSKIDELHGQAREKGLSAQEFKAMLIDRMDTSAPIESPVSELGMSENDKRRFSITRLMASMVPGASGEAIKAAAFERECSAQVGLQVLNEHPKLKDRGGCFLPYEVQPGTAHGRKEEDFMRHPEFRQFFPRNGKRDMTVGSATQGANLVGTELLAAEFAPMLRDRLVTAQLGVRTLSGLVGNIDFGRQTGASTAYWPGEATNITAESNLTIGHVAMAPNEVGAYVDVSRRLLAQSTPGAEGLIRSDILTQVALAVDTAFFHGTGGVQPTGLENTTGVGTVNAAGIGWAGLVEFETDVAAANADIGSMYMVVDAAGRGLLKTTPKETGYPIYLIGDDGRANGYPVVATNLLTTGYAFFGVFSTAIIGEWGVMQILVDPYTQGIAGLTRFIINHMVDVGIRQPGAFTFASNLS